MMTKSFRLGIMPSSSADGMETVNKFDASLINNGAVVLRTMEKRAQSAFRAYKDTFPTSIWHCCRRFCFTCIAIDPEKLFLLEELRLIHQIAGRIHANIHNISSLVETRRKGIGGSYVGFVAPCREQREIYTNETATGQQSALTKFADFAMKRRYCHFCTERRTGRVVRNARSKKYVRRQFVAFSGSRGIFSTAERRTSIPDSCLLYPAIKSSSVSSTLPEFG